MLCNINFYQLELNSYLHQHSIYQKFCYYDKSKHIYGLNMKNQMFGFFNSVKHIIITQKALLKIF